MPVWLLKYLNDPQELEKNKTKKKTSSSFLEKEIFAMPSRSKIENFAKNLLQDLFGIMEDPEIEEEKEISEIAQTCSTARTFAESLQQKIEEKRVDPRDRKLPNNL